MRFPAAALYQARYMSTEVIDLIANSIRQSLVKNIEPISADFGYDSLLLLYREIP
jgi:hypothetical protein